MQDNISAMTLILIGKHMKGTFDGMDQTAAANFPPTLALSYFSLVSIK
jgi:hypothetical protein